MSSDNNRNDLEPTADPEKREWVSFGVALQPEFKERLERVARETGLAPSAFARMVLMREVAQLERSTA